MTPIVISIVIRTKLLLQSTIFVIVIVIDIDIVTVIDQGHDKHNRGVAKRV